MLTQHYFTFAFEGWPTEVCGGYPDGQPLRHHIVREAAFWRRARELITQHLTARTAGREP